MSAEIAAFAPGIGVTGISTVTNTVVCKRCRRQVLTRMDPGSEMMGVPASLTSATDFSTSKSTEEARPFFSCSMRLPTLLASFSWFRETSGRWMLNLRLTSQQQHYCERRNRVVRVSSAAITSTDRRMSRARCEMSCRHPIGVLTRCLSLTDTGSTYRTPFRQKEGEEEANRWERRTPCSTRCNRHFSLATNMGQKNYHFEREYCVLSGSLYGSYRENKVTAETPLAT